MEKYKPHDKNYEEKVKKSFDKQNAMKSLGITLEEIKPGCVELKMPFKKEFTQQHGFVHAGIISTVLDSACGYAAFSLMPKEASVLSVEFKTNLLRPAHGEYFLVTGKVLKAGKSITVCQAEAYAIGKASKKLVAQMTGTMMTIIDKAGVNE